MSSRQTVLAWLSRRVGFPFSENDLSPAVKRRVGEVADLKQQIDSQGYLISQKQAAIIRLKARKRSQTTWLLASIIVGAILLVVIVGVIFFVVAFLLYRTREKTERLIQERTEEIAKLNADLAALGLSLDAKLSSLTPDIFGELSAAHEVRVASASSGSTVQLVKETIKEVVMVPCGYCHNLMSQTSLRCPHCGAARKT